MSESHWIQWTRTRLPPREREDLLTALTSEQKAHLLEHDYVWVEGVGVQWNPSEGDPLRRARFTHGIHFQTQRGEFYIDSDGNARGLSGSKDSGTEIELEGNEHLIIREDDVLAALE